MDIGEESAVHPITLIGSRNSPLFESTGKVGKCCSARFCIAAMHTRRLIPKYGPFQFTALCLMKTLCQFLEPKSRKIPFLRWWELGCLLNVVAYAFSNQKPAIFVHMSL